MFRRSADLAIAIATASVALLAIPLAADNTALRAVSGMLLVLVLPGYAMTAAGFPRPGLGLAERILFSVGLSLVVAVLGGFLLNWTPWGLQGGSWLGLLWGTTLAASLVAFARRQRDPAVTANPVSPGLSRRQGLMLALAALGVVVALGFSRTPTPLDRSQGYTLLWMLPVEDGRRNAVRLGVSSMESSVTHYRLELRVDGQTVHEWPSIGLAPGEKWESSAELLAGQTGRGLVEALLHRLDSPDRVYRHVTLWGSQPEAK